MARVQSLRFAACHTCAAHQHDHAHMTADDPGAQHFATDAYVKMHGHAAAVRPVMMLAQPAASAPGAAAALGTSAATPAIAAAHAALGDRIDGEIEARYPALETFYQDLHRHPELGLKETETLKKMTAQFTRLGLEDVQTIGGGVVGMLRNGPGPVSIIRCELDALPVTEETDLPYKSEAPGVMHACGHDLHMTALLGAADILKAEKANWSGTLVFVAQPAEETLKGAKAMIDAGLFDKIPKPQNVIAMHTSGAVETGKVAFPPPGPVMAAADTVEVVLRGVGAHGAHPDLGVDPIVLGAEFVLKMQTLIAREVDPLEPAVVTVGSFQAGAAANVISDMAKLQLTVRTFTQKTRDFLLKRIAEVAQELSKTDRAPEPTVTVVDSSPPVVNDRALSDRVRGAMTAVMGDAIVDMPATTSSEDFYRLAQVVDAKALRFYVGAMDAANPKVSNHSPKFAPLLKTVLPLAIKSTIAGVLDLHKPGQ